jgi:hypothetical protein
VAQAAYHGQGLLSATVDCGYTATKGLLPDAAAAKAPKWVMSPSLKQLYYISLVINVIYRINLKGAACFRVHGLSVNQLCAGYFCAHFLSGISIKIMAQFEIGRQWWSRPYG